MNKKILIVYFSKSGEQYGVGNIVKGNTAILSEIIAEQIGADLFEVKLKNDNYPKDYKTLTEVALEEKNKNIRPEIIGKVENFDDYDTIFIGTPNWWADLPMALYTFIENYDWNNKTIIPFVTHEGSGMSSIPSKINKVANPKEMLDGFDIYGHVVQKEKEQAKKEVISWLNNIEILD